MNRLRHTLLALTLLSTVIAARASADEPITAEQIRHMVSRGEVLALESILLHFPTAKYGKLLDLEVERDHDLIVYQLEFLRSNGQVFEISIDASNGSLLKQAVELKQEDGD